MGRMIIVVLLLVLTNNLSAQTLNGVHLSKLTAEYVQIIGTQKFFSNKVIIQLDFGQKMRLGESWVLEDKNGKAMTFNSMVGALNFMEEQGYEFVTAYAVTMQGSNVYHFLLKRKEE